MSSVYLLYDADDTLLYVGASTSVDSRILRHRRERTWGSAIARAEIRACESREAALDLETTLIATLTPVHNIQKRTDGESPDGGFLVEKGFSIKLDVEFETIIKKAAEDERRTIKEVVQEALRLYVGKRSQKIG